jgi:hypothetical protein
MAIKSEANGIDHLQRQLGLNGSVLGDITNLGVALPNRVPHKANLTAGEALLAQNAFQQHRLSRAISANNRNELSGVDLETQV